MILTRGGIARFHRVTDNIFIRCGKHAIEFPNVYNYADGNVYSNMPPGYIKIEHPAPALKLDMETCRKIFEWEMRGRQQGVTASLDPGSLEFTMTIPSDQPASSHKPGPFDEFTTMKQISIDPRK
jgi:hypothetical protein